MARPKKAPVGAIWRPFAFVPAGAIIGLQRDAIIRYSDVELQRRLRYGADIPILETWPVEVVVTNLAAMAANRTTQMSAPGYLNVTYLSGLQTNATEDVTVSTAETLIASGLGMLTTDPVAQLDPVFEMPRTDVAPTS